jgi:hypothetical protein
MGKYIGDIGDEQGREDARTLKAERIRYPRSTLVHLLYS